MGYQRLKIPKVVNIDAIISLHYNEFASGFIFPGETHDFWELVYVDKGYALIGADEKKHLLSQGYLFLHKPNQFHTIHIERQHTSNIAVIAFDGENKALHPLCDKPIAITMDSRAFMEKIVSHASKAFVKPLANSADRIVPRKDAAPELLQMIPAYLELLLLNELEEMAGITDSSDVFRKASNRNNSLSYNTLLVKNIEEYLQENLRYHVSISSISHHFHIAEPTLRSIFKRINGKSVIHYLIYLRVKEAKWLIRQDKYSLKEISTLCGFSTVNYFSNRFRVQTGMTPGEYRNSVFKRMD